MGSNANSELRGVSEFGWLVALTVSATCMSSYLFDIDCPVLFWWARIYLPVVAWAIVTCRWWGFRQRRSGHLALYVVALAIEIGTVGQLRTSWFPCPVRPEVAAYKTLLASVRARNLPAVEASLKRYPVPDFKNQRVYDFCRQDNDCASAENPLQTAVSCGDVAITAALLDHGADGTGGDGNYMFGIAAQHGDVPMMRLLLKHGAQLTEGAGECPALAQAVQHRHPAAVAFLLGLGASPNTAFAEENGFADETGKSVSVLEYAKQQHLTQIAKMIARAGGK